ncbi:MAG: hypothetical protein LBJ63_08120 [Prevotellaceae bacterium]|jgi:hypothetical protein|nr:hypothetical protein [Prevotellaceae bacterium]
MSNYIYLKTEQLPKEVKTRHKIKAEAKIPRLDVTAQAGYYKPLEALKNPKGMIYFNLMGTDGLINSTDRRRSDVWLQCSAGNFSSIYTLDLKTENIVGYGNPADDKFFKPKRLNAKDGTIKQVERPNPFYEYNKDGFLFIAKPDFSELEIIIVPNGRYIIQSIGKEYADGKMDDVLTALRQAAQPIFHY